MSAELIEDHQRHEDDDDGGAAGDGERGRRERSEHHDHGGPGELGADRRPALHGVVGGEHEQHEAEQEPGDGDGDGERPGALGRVPGLRLGGDVDAGAEGGERGEHDDVGVAPAEGDVAGRREVAGVVEVQPPRAEGEEQATDGDHDQAGGDALASPTWRMPTLADRIDSPSTMIVNRP